MARPRHCGWLPASPEAAVQILEKGTDTQQKEMLEHYLTAACMIPLRVCLWPSLERVFFAGVEVPGTPESKFTDEERELYRQILGFIPILAPVLNACHKREMPAALERFVSLLCDSALSSRNADTHTIKTHVLLYVPPIPQVEHLKLAQSIDPKTSRGWKDPRCSALLAPPRFLEDLFADPSDFGERVQNQTIKISGKEWPSFLYEDPLLAVAGQEHQGLLRGPLLLRAYRCIFTGAVSGMSKTAKTNTKSQAEIHGITKVEPWGIIYAAVLIRQALSSSKQWKEKDLRFDYLTFTSRLQELFEYDGSKWVLSLLRWWNNRISFEQRPRQIAPDSGEDADDEHVTPITEMLKRAERDSDESSEEDEENDKPWNLPLAGGPLLEPSNPSLRNMHYQVHQMAAAVGRELQELDNHGERAPDAPSSDPSTEEAVSSPASAPLPTPSDLSEQASSPDPASFSTPPILSEPAAIASTRASFNTNGKRPADEDPLRLELSDSDEQLSLPKVIPKEAAVTTTVQSLKKKKLARRRY